MGAVNRSGRDFWDPEGQRFGTPTWPWRTAPDGLLTRRQLSNAGLRPGGQAPVGQVCWRSRRRAPRGAVRVRFALLYDVGQAVPRREASPAQLVALAKADVARRTCGTCGQTPGYVIPGSLGECLDCADARGAVVAARWVA